MREEILSSLLKMAEPGLAEFQSRIISDTQYPILGVRVPKIRKIARELSRGDWQRYLQDQKLQYYEEILTAGLALAYAVVPFMEKTTQLRAFLPRLDSWALTDSMVPTLKINPAYLEDAWNFSLECLAEEGEYIRRFGLIMMLDYFLTPVYIPVVAEQVLSLSDERYYVRMAAAWLLAEMAVQDPQRVLQILHKGSLDMFTHNMTIRKMRESYRISQEIKEEATALRRKEKK